MLANSWVHSQSDLGYPVTKVKMKSIIVLLIICLIANISKVNSWDHQHQAEWFDDFSECSLNYQSPIEINTRDAIEAYMPPLKFHNYSMVCSEPATITNNGHSASITLSEKCNRPQITGGPLPRRATYEAVSFHFHWGSEDEHGSEHTINAERYSMELHIVHQNTKYSSMDEAAKHRDGLAVQALFYEANAYQQTSFDGLQNVVTSLKSVREFNTNSLMKNPTLSNLFGDIDTSRFYTYQGSLTTPPCSQAVTWIIFPDAIEVNPDQIHQFRLLSDDQGTALVNNYRFIQPKDIRKVYLRSNMTPKDKKTFSSPSTPGPREEEYFDYTNVL